MPSKVDQATCIGCTACVSVCPSEAISMEDKPEGQKAVIDAAKCTSCGTCISVCPVQAISPEETKTITPEESK